MFKRRPEEVGPTPRLTHLLQALGRRLHGARGHDQRAGPGRHGQDHRGRRGSPPPACTGWSTANAQGRTTTAPLHPGLDRARAEFAALVEAHPALLLEDKGLGLVLHYRTAPELAELANATAVRMVDETGLALQKGDMMAEVRTPGRNKGDALKTFMAEPPFRGAEPVFVGDDLTDESAFAAARELGGYGVLVGPQRETAASFRLDDVASVLGWLEAFAASGPQLPAS